MVSLMDSNGYYLSICYLILIAPILFVLDDILSFDDFYILVMGLLCNYSVVLFWHCTYSDYVISLFCELPFLSGLNFAMISITC